MYKHVSDDSQYTLDENRPLSTNETPQDPRCEIVMKAERIPADRTGGLAAVGEIIAYDVTSTNNGNVDIARVTMLDTVGACRRRCSAW